MDKSFVKKLIASYLIVLAAFWGMLLTFYQKRIFMFSPPDHVVAPLVILMFVTGFVTLMIFLLIAMARYVYVDARQRGMNEVLWTLVVIFVPYFIGLIVYLIVRTPLQSACLACHAVVSHQNSFCPQCGNALKRQCGSCHATLEVNDRFCPHCGAAARLPQQVTQQG
jgi:RNA polymerase subunit RPABC4/transcription elongation factor Spt4